mmetsp:Transcript_17632/g.21365  ORF Transcript_17632/g.21365 Transcript_17632/m.21365 type:complete len:328 (-) Transcript_17632:56-1039(-)
MTSQDLIKDGWFKESEVMWPGQGMTLAVEKVVTEFRSNFQEILVFDSSTYGRVLVLDGVIQLTERDEFAYQEMIVHLPMFAHGNAKNVCIIGGGDGGVLREVCKHKSVESVVMCEIDPSVVEVSKKYFSDTMATAFRDERLTLLHEDGAVFLETTEKKFDVIIVDSSDPVGPAESLFEETFFAQAKSALAPGGILTTQGECMWLHLNLISDVLASCGNLFPVVDYAYTTIPTYPSGQIGFIMCCMNNVDLSTPAMKVPDHMLPKLRYYNNDIHRAAFTLPQFAESVVAPYRKTAPFSRILRLCQSNTKVVIFASIAALGAFTLRRLF